MKKIILILFFLFIGVCLIFFFKQKNFIYSNNLKIDKLNEIVEYDTIKEHESDGKIKKIQIFEIDKIPFSVVEIREGSSSNYPKKSSTYPILTKQYNKGRLSEKENCKIIEDNIYDKSYPSREYRCKKMMYGNCGAPWTPCKYEEYLITKVFNQIYKIKVKEQFFSTNYLNKYCESIYYNQRGNIDVVYYSKLCTVEDAVVEKKLYIDGEYIKTKCFKNDSLGTKDEEYVDGKKHCYN